MPCILYKKEEGEKHPLDWFIASKTIKKVLQPLRLSTSEGVECTVAARKEQSSCNETAKLADSSAYYISMGD